MVLMRANQPEAAVCCLPGLLCTPYFHVHVYVTDRGRDSMSKVGGLGAHEVGGYYIHSF